MSDSVVWNGIDGRSGGYLFAPSSVEDLCSLARQGANSRTTELRQPIPPSQKGKRQPLPTGRPRLQFGGSIYGTDPENLGDAGWGVIFSKNADRAVMEALVPLLRLRRGEATAKSEHRFRFLAESDGYCPGESAVEFLERHGKGPGPVDPDQMPYYLLLVGGAQEIPYEFQYQLASQYAVGRLALESPEEYARYAAGLVELERCKVRQAKRVSFFGVEHAGDPATQASASQLVAPLAEKLRGKCPKYQFQTALGPDATKKRLRRMLGGDETPSLLFAASHGVGFPCGDPLQRELQGAILCSDSPGPGAWAANRSIPADHMFSAADLAKNSRLGGLILFLMSCFGGGTPQYDSFGQHRGEPPRMLTARPFEARLPQRLLAHKNGNAMAVIAHVDRTWTSSFRWRSAGPQLQTFESVLRALLDGRRVGSAMDFFTLRRGELSAALNSELERDPAADPWLLSALWTAHNDARSFILLGYPAARLN